MNEGIGRGLLKLNSFTITKRERRMTETRVTKILPEHVGMEVCLKYTGWIEVLMVHGNCFFGGDIKGNHFTLNIENDWDIRPAQPKEKKPSERLSRLSYIDDDLRAEIEEILDEHHEAIKKLEGK